MQVPSAFTPRALRDPAMAETRAGSVFTPAIAAWSSPGRLGGLGALGFPTWMGYALAAGFLLLAWKRKIPWWAGIGAAGAAWWYMGGQGNMNVGYTQGVAITAAGTTYQLSPNSPGTLVTAPDGSASMTIAGTSFPVLSTDKNPDGTTTFYLDNAAA